MLRASGFFKEEQAQKIDKDLVEKLLLMPDMRRRQIAKITEEEGGLIARRIKK